MNQALQRLLKPQSIAIVGASAHPHKPGGRVVRYLQEYGFAGPVYPVNAARTEIAGLRCYPSLTAIGQPVDAVIIALPATEVKSVLAEAVRTGAGGAIVYSSGFRELGTEAGEQLQAEIMELAQSAGLALIGPNTAGIINVGLKANLCFAIMFENQPPLRLGGVSMVSHGGGIGGILFPLARELGVDFSYWLNLGNEAGMDLADSIAFLAEDPATKVIMAHVEGIRRPGSFLEAVAAAHRNGKTVVVLKTGLTEAGARAVSSHTGAVAGQGRMAEAFFTKAGTVQVDDAWELLGAAQVLKDGKVSRGPNLAVVTNSGSMGAMAADLAVKQGFQVAPLSAATLAVLKRTLPAYVQPNNPVDVANMPALDPNLVGKAVDILLADPQVDNLLVNITLGVGHDLDLMCSQIIGSFRNSDKPLAVVVTGTALAGIDMLCAGGVPTFRDAPKALRALTAARQAACVTPYVGPAPPVAAPPRPASTRRTLNEAESAALVGRHGIPVARSAVAADPAGAVAAAEAIGFPVAVKILSAGIPHKSEAGGVRLDLRNAEAVRGAAGSVMANARQAYPSARLDGLLVQEMCPRGIELVVGATRDPVYGVGILVGLGGVTMELLQDVALAVSPLTRSEAHQLVRRLRSFALLDGFRGAAPADIEALVDLILAVDRLMQEELQVQELDLNPTLVHPAGQGVTVADALIMTSG